MATNHAEGVVLHRVCYSQSKALYGSKMSVCAVEPIAFPREKVKVKFHVDSDSGEEMVSSYRYNSKVSLYVRFNAVAN